MPRISYSVNDFKNHSVSSVFLAVQWQKAEQCAKSGFLLRMGVLLTMRPRQAVTKTFARENFLSVTDSERKSTLILQMLENMVVIDAAHHDAQNRHRARLRLEVQVGFRPLHDGLKSLSHSKGAHGVQLSVPVVLYCV